MATMKKAQEGMRVGRARGQKCGLEKGFRKEERMYERENRRIDRQADREARREARRAPKYRAGGKVTTAKKGGSFPDLNKDGKVTKADILKGRGVIKNGGKLKKARGGATLSPSKSSTSNRLASYGRPLGKNLTGKLKTGGKVKKAMGGMNMGKCRGGCY